MKGKIAEIAGARKTTTTLVGQGLGILVESITNPKKAGTHTRKKTTKNRTKTSKTKTKTKTHKKVEVQNITLTMRSKSLHITSSSSIVFH